MSGTATDGNDVIVLGVGGEVNGLKGNDTITGSAGNDTLFGGAGDDSLSGGAGADLLRGGLGNDIMLGGTGDDTLRGAEGNDTITGGTGQDTIYGGEGADTIIFLAITDGDDFVVGFDAGLDRVLVSAAGFNGPLGAGLTAGMDLSMNDRFITVNNFGGDVEATTAAGIGQFIYDADVGNLWWDVDGIGAEEVLLVAQIVNLGDLTAATFTAADLGVIA